MTTFLITWFSFVFCWYVFWIVASLIEKRKWYYYIKCLYKGHSLLEKIIMFIGSLLNVNTILTLVFFIKSFKRKAKSN